MKMWRRDCSEVWHLDFECYPLDRHRKETDENTKKLGVVLVREVGNIADTDYLRQCDLCFRPRTELRGRARERRVS